jgi:protease-4
MSDDQIHAVTPPPTPPPPRRIWPWVVAGLGVLFLGFVGLIGVAVWAIHSAATSDDSDSSSLSLGSSNSVAVIEVNGVIMSSEPLVTQLRKFADDNSVKAIVLRINSPGGDAAASQEVYREVRRIRDVVKKPIISSIDSVGASGAYYIASGTSKIYANDASIVGSIGVIIEWVNYGDLLKWAKMKQVTIKSGELKDTGSPTRDLTPKEQAYLQGLVNNMYEQFLHDVSDGRNIPVATLRPLANGQVWTGQQALPLHLIDVSGSYHDAILEASRLGGISGEPNIVRPSKPKSGLAAWLSSDSDSDDLFPTPGKILEQYPGFYFLWK